MSIEKKSLIMLKNQSTNGVNTRKKITSKDKSYITYGVIMPFKLDEFIYPKIEFSITKPCEIEEIEIEMSKLVKMVDEMVANKLQEILEQRKKQFELETAFED